jgi:hypothetical protein
VVVLASIDDYAAVTGSYPADEGRVHRLLELASDAVLAGAHGQQIVSGTVTSTVRPWEGVAYLPQRPMTAVASVVADGATVDPSEYRWEPGGNRRPALLIRREDGRDVWWPMGELTVEYTAGWVVVPGQIVAAVVAMVVGTMTAGGGPAVTQEGAGPFQMSFAPGQSPDLSLTRSTRRLLDQLCGVDGPSSVPVHRDQP